ncbi:hypothetical protein B0H63DRAFT_551560 [Podospora didyma]|uniref:Uncharacterized protein n=1 Tax=Podospora didyma TaxID=330526 RepID=A0AAE0N787_9PEZI|nr:hypothetical protein B0H63DRAFT_551560 [Podospora didyma]
MAKRKASSDDEDMPDTKYTTSPAHTKELGSPQHSQRRHQGQQQPQRLPLQGRSDTVENISTTASEFEKRAYENGILDPLATHPPPGLSTIQYRLTQRRTSTQPSEHAHQGYYKSISNSYNEPRASFLVQADIMRRWYLRQATYQAAYDGAVLVNARNRALFQALDSTTTAAAAAALNKAAEETAVLTCVTDGKSAELFAHYFQDGQYHWSLVARESLLSCPNRGRELIRNTEEEEEEEEEGGGGGGVLGLPSSEWPPLEDLSDLGDLSDLSDAPDENAAPPPPPLSNPPAGHKLFNTKYDTLDDLIDDLNKWAASAQFNTYGLILAVIEAKFVNPGLQQTTPPPTGETAWQAPRKIFGPQHKAVIASYIDSLSVLNRDIAKELRKQFPNLIFTRTQLRHRRWRVRKLATKGYTPFQATMKLFDDDGVHSNIKWPDPGRTKLEGLF